MCTPLLSAMVMELMRIKGFAKWEEYGGWKKLCSNFCGKKVNNIDQNPKSKHAIDIELNNDGDVLNANPIYVVEMQKTKSNI